MKRQPKNLITKIAEACNAVEGVAKTKTHKDDGYPYATAAEVVKCIRRELFKRNVILTANEIEITEHEMRTYQSDGAQAVTLKLEYTLRDGDSSEMITMTAFGAAMDARDKALYKAKTGALKYFLRGLGLMPDDLDPENEQPATPEDEGERDTEAEKPQPTNGLDYQARAFQSAVQRSGKTETEVTNYLRDEFNVQSVSQLNKAQFADAITWACKFKPNQGVEQFYDPIKQAV